MSSCDNLASDCEIREFQENAELEGEKKIEKEKAEPGVWEENQKIEECTTPDIVSQVMGCMTEDPIQKPRPRAGSKRHITLEEPSRIYQEDEEKKKSEEEIEEQGDGPFGFEGSDFVFDSNSESDPQ